MEPLCLINMNEVPLPSTPKRSRPPTLVHHGSNHPKGSEEGHKTNSMVNKLLEKIPSVDQYFNVLKKVGEGTFSSVFVATSKQLANEKKFAIKHLTPTSHPSRIVQEMKCLQDIGGRDNVVGLELCIRNNDAVAFVMPYFPHDSFSKYVSEMTVGETQVYMKNLLIALQRVHSFNVIHRDVKPSNFLYSRKEQRFLLVDFGLSHEVNESSHRTNSNSITCLKNSRKRPLETSEKEEAALNEHKRTVLHSLSNNVPEATGERQSSKLSQKKKSPPFKENSPASKDKVLHRNISQVKRNLQFGNITTEVKREVLPSLLAGKLGPSGARQHAAFNFSTASTSFFRVQNSQVKSQLVFGAKDEAPFRKPVLKSQISLGRACGCDRKPRICNNCILRKPMNAPRAGTPGYRSPEVLLKYPHQTTAVDIWSAGVIMLSILSGSYPFFRAADDISALIEMITVFGTAELKNTATKLGRNLLCNEIRKPLKLNKLCERLRRRPTVDDPTEKCSKVATCNSCFQKVFPAEGCLCSEYVIDGNVDLQCHVAGVAPKQIFPKEAYDLLSKLLAVDPEKRYTAEAALRHPFFLMDFTKE